MRFVQPGVLCPSVDIVVEFHLSLLDSVVCSAERLCEVNFFVLGTERRFICCSS